MFFGPLTNWKRKTNCQPPKSFFPTSIPCLASCASRRFPHSFFQHRPPFQSMSSCSRRALPCTASSRSWSRMGPHAAWCPSTSHHQVPPSSTLENEKKQPRGSLAGGNSEQNCCSKDLITSSTAQGGGGSFKNRKPIGEVGCCESGMAERSHWWIERCLISLTLSLSFSDYLPTYLPIYQSIYVSIYLSIYLSLSLFHLSICLSV